MHTKFVLGSCLLSLAALWAAGGPLLADDWEDPRRSRLEGRIRELRGEEPERIVADDSLVTLRHGDVRLVTDLARVDLTLEIHNTSGGVLEWRRNFALDPQCEVIGATLRRADVDAVPAQTLTIADARRIYDEVRTPRPTRTRTRPNPWGPWGRTNSDPLRVERVQRNRIQLTIWPVAADETLRVELTFVTPLRGRGSERRYVDPILADLGSAEAVSTGPDLPPVVTRPSGPVASGAIAPVQHQWMIHPGDLVLDAAPTGMTPAGKAGEVLRFVSAGRSGRSAEPPTVRFRRPRTTEEVLAVPGGGLGTRIAIWRFDPVDYLKQRGVTPRHDMRIRILSRQGSTSRIAPWTFEATAEPLPVTARLLPQSRTLRYAVEVLDGEGNTLHLFEEDRGVRRESADRDLDGAVTGWHRAALVGRVIAWADTDAGRMDEALEFAVDLGVLVPGTAGLAVPNEEWRQLSRPSRSLYRRDGAPLGAQGRQADMKWPPQGSTTP